MSAHAKPAPVEAKFWTPGSILLIAFMVTGLPFVIARYMGGLAAVTNLDNQHPWGLWIGIDVATGVALAAGGFTTSALAHIFGRHQYESVTRPALLTAMLGYTVVAIGLVVDIGRSWAIWHPIIYWQPNSVLFEVAMCVVIYLHVLYIEFIPVVAEHFKGRISLPGPLGLFDNVIEGLLRLADRILGKVMWIFIIAGVVLSCMHQSGLGSLMLIAPTKLHPLWYTPILPLLFLVSAISVGYPMVVFETTLATSSLRLDDEMEILTPLTRITTLLLGIYMVLKVGDMVVRETYVYLLDGTVQSKSFLVEMIVGVLIPWILLLSPQVRRSRRALFIACSLIVGGIALNRMNVFVVGFQPPYAERSYFPAIGEMAITAALISGLIFFYRICVTCFPVISSRHQEVPS
jgi:Ni/Fe-hydrogenase subunit HybB-like protein